MSIVAQVSDVVHGALDLFLFSLLILFLYKRILEIHSRVSIMYGGIFLPPICKINYVNMQDSYVYTQANYVDLQFTNIFG